MSTYSPLFLPRITRITTDSIRFLTANGREYTLLRKSYEGQAQMGCYEKLRCERSIILPLVHSVTSVFKIRIRDHPRNPREKTSSLARITVEADK